jgi:poly-gamma-glutamate capsule biosynthesis protein CapA/YwtB (metallophosphatase superfamily)
VDVEEIPPSDALFSAATLDAHLSRLAEPPLSLILGGDVMLGGRAKRTIRDRGPDYPFEALAPLLRRAPIVVANLEGPFARNARRLPRTHSYRVRPKLAHSLRRAGINVVTLANNHLLDCDRNGVVETLEALAGAGISPIGGGLNEALARVPVIRQAGLYSAGLLGYYWNPRCAATADLPGSAMDTPEALEADIRALSGLADHIVVTFHWGVPYNREPMPEERAKARLAIDCGADVVVGHHQHVMQPFEIYRGRPIFYGVGNFAFGSGNSRAEGLLIGVRFEVRTTRVFVYPLYVKNRDPRVNYQPKAMRGEGAERILRRLAQMSGPSGEYLRVEDGRGILDLRRDV